MYQDSFNEHLKIYEQHLAAYEDLVNSSMYQEITSTMPFQFLSATQLCKTLELYDKLEKKPHMYFPNMDQAKVFYKNLISFKSQSNKLLEDAAFMAEVWAASEKVNDWAMSSPYLGTAYKIYPNQEIAELAKQCLVEIPKYPKLLTKAFRWNYIESCILSLNMPDLEWLCKASIIKAEDIDHISLTETHNNYQDKILALCQYFGREAPIQKTYQVKLKGVTFTNDDGTSRQDNLRELKNILDTNPNALISLTAESYTYVPEIGNPEPAIRILWDGKCIGNIAKDVAASLVEQFNNPQYTVNFAGLTGGQNDGYSLGCTVNLNVIASEYIKSAPENAVER